MDSKRNEKAKRCELTPEVESKKSKRRRLHSKVESTINEGQSFKDYLCPICLEILIEPVELPCKHELCLACFHPLLENASLLCPICRKRISIWARKKKAKKLVNTERWDRIKELFPILVNRRMGILDDLDSHDENSPPTQHIIAPDGEVRKEYEEELQKIEVEKKEDLEAIKNQEENDRTYAYALQKEEMGKLTRSPKSPTQHEQKLLQLFKTKSPMKLRSRQTISTHGKKSKLQSKSTQSRKAGEFSGRSTGR